MSKKNTPPNHVLPSYVQIDEESCPNREVLRKRAKEVKFPLSHKDQEILDQLTEKFMQEENCAGLAAPQIGYGKRIIIYHVPEDLGSYRKDAYDVIPPTVLINPEYEPVGEEKTIDWEGCFSVKHSMAEVPRFTMIRYHGYDVSGKKIEGTARGFLARLLQHEIGHLNGQLFIDLVTPDCRAGTFEEMRALRLKEQEEYKRSKG